MKFMETNVKLINEIFILQWIHFLSSQFIFLFNKTFFFLSYCACMNRSQSVWILRHSNIFLIFTNRNFNIWYECTKGEQKKSKTLDSTVCRYYLFVCNFTSNTNMHWCLQKSTSRKGLYINWLEHAMHTKTINCAYVLLLT